MNDLFGIGELSNNSLEVIKMLYPDLAQPSVKKVSLALEGTIDFSTIPFKYLGYLSKKADISLKKHLGDFQNKIDSKSNDQIGSVPPEIGVPILEELTRVTSKELSSMYVNLLVNAALVDNSKYAHPSFINVLKNISVDEAKIIEVIRNDRWKLVFIRYDRYRLSNSSIIPLSDNFSNVDKLVNMLYPENTDFYLNNLVSLGIITQEDYYYKSNKSLYEEFEKSLVSKKDKAQHKLNLAMEDENKEGDFGNASEILPVWGRYQLTYYGEEFIKGISYS